MDSLLQRRAAKGLLARRPSERRMTYKEVVGLKRQMYLIEEAYEEMKKLGNYFEEQNQAIADTIEEDKVIMMKL